MDNLIVPVYLNQRLVFDLLAMLQGGISTVTTIAKSEDVTSDKTQKISASLGLSQALSLLMKIDLSGEKTTSSNLSQKNSLSEVKSAYACIFVL